MGSDFCDSICDYGKLHLDVYVVTNITKFRSFQYRLLQRGLVTNLQLAKWGIVSSELCSFCHQSVETLVHLFCDCFEV